MPALAIEPLTREAFAPFGQVIGLDGTPPLAINGGMTDRYDDLARIELGGPDPRPLLSIFRGRPYALPLSLTQLERHPLGSQAFFPLSQRPFLVIVALDHHGTPQLPRAFRTAPGQGVNIAMNTWHGSLAPLEAESDFLVVDRGGLGNNLEVFVFPEPWTIG